MEAQGRHAVAGPVERQVRRRFRAWAEREGLVVLGRAFDGKVPCHLCIGVATKDADRLAACGTCARADRAELAVEMCHPVGGGPRFGCQAHRVGAMRRCLLWMAANSTTRRCTAAFHLLGRSVLDLHSWATERCRRSLRKVRLPLSNVVLTGRRRRGALAVRPMMNQGGCTARVPCRWRSG